MEKINLVELLKDCPNGMELDCTMFENVSFRGIQNGTSQIMIHTPDGIQFLNSFGCYHDSYRAKCVIFPKGKTTWEGFVPPCKFKDGDILSNGICICIYDGNENGKHYGCYVGVGHIHYPDYFINHPQNSYFTKENSRLATKEEKEKLFKTIKDKGYKWNPETKTLEKLIIPRFKVGDRIKYKGDDAIGRIEKIADNVYHVDYSFDDGVVYVGLKSQNDYELVPNKFDITTLKPFDKVLVRDNDEQLWLADLFGFYGKTPFPFMCVGHYMNQCVPYEGNEHLLGTTDNCDEFYKTWE